MSIAQAFNNFVGEPIRFRNFGLAWFRLSQLLHERTNGAYDATYMKMARFIRPKVTLPQPAEMTNQQIGAAVDGLLQDGCFVLPIRLSNDDIAALSSFVYSVPARGVDLSKEVRVSPGEIPCDEGRYTWRVAQLIEHPVVQRLVLDGPYCAIAQDYLRCRPILTSIGLWLDPKYQGNYSPHMYHYDNDGPGFLKFFIYLTDVNIGSGAHYFIKGTHAHSKPKPFAHAKIYDENELFGFFKREQEYVAAAPAGTILAEDTAGFHRGSTIIRDYRLLVQLQFSVLDIPEETELKEKVRPVGIPNLHPGLAAITRKFFCDRT